MRRATLTSMARGPQPETIPVPASARFPIELEPPTGFRPDEPSSWPRVQGRLEYVGGRLLYMPPCGDLHQVVAASCVGLLVAWAGEHPEFTVGSNEAGMLLGGDVRGADAAVWRRETRGEYTGGYVRVPPILAVEVAGRDEGRAKLRAKARWYLRRGVEIVWVILPRTRELIVVGPEDESCHGSGARLPSHAMLPGLAPAVYAFFRQLD